MPLSLVSVQKLVSTPTDLQSLVVQAGAAECAARRERLLGRAWPPTFRSELWLVLVPQSCGFL